VDFSEKDLDFESGERKLSEPARQETKTSSGEAAVSSLRPVSRRGELTREEYRENSGRARRVSILSGMFLVILFILGIFLYLWHSWFDDMFSEPETMAVPNFVGVKLEDILANPAYTDYFNINPAYESSETVAEGCVISQNPAANRSVIKSENKADIKLTVSSGTTVILLPELTNTDYRDAIIKLNNLSLKHEENFVKSEDVTEGFVISMIPPAGTELKAGDTVYLEISTGPEIKYAQMPQLVGDAIRTAEAKLDGLNLVLGNVTEEPNSAPAGTVTWQSMTAGASVQEKTRINLIISSGPTETEPPVTEDGEAPPAQEGGEGTPDMPVNEDGSVG